MNDRGAVLSFVLIVVGVLSALGMAMAAMVRVDTIQQAAQESVTRNFLAAEAGINRGIGEFRNIFLDANVPEGSDFDEKSFTIDGHDVRYRLQGIPSTPPPSQQVTLPAGDAFAGLNSLQYRYAVRADDVAPDGSSRAGLGAQFTLNNVPIFQFLFFYTNDLEFDSPAQMTLHGRIHSNANLFLNSGGIGAPVTIDDSPEVPVVQVSAAGSIFRGQNTASPAVGCADVVSIATLVDGDDAGSDLDLLSLPCNGGGTRPVLAAEAAAWQGSVIPNLGNITAPRLDELMSDAWEQADLRIVLDLRSAPEKLHASCADEDAFAPIEVRNADRSRNVALTARLREFMWANPGKVFYNDVPRTDLCPGRNDVCAADPASYAHPFNGANAVYRGAADGAMDSWWASPPNAHVRCDYRRGGFFNNREKRGPYAVAGQGTWMRLLDIDLQALLDWNRAQAPGDRLFDPDDRSDGGIVLYASVDGTASSGLNDYGVRLLDSADLGFPTAVADPTGVTVVTDQAIYVEGDYNSVDKVPAAIIGDSLNVLSQNWETGVNDRKSAKALSVANRPTAPTTINAAFIAGVDRSSAASSNGGVNNYPRLHEAWNGTAFAYRGSMVSLATPVHVNGYFLSAGPAPFGPDVYTAPRRNWDYDPDFDDVANLPPLTPRVVWVQQALFTQQFQ